jgi:hypothetical protein
MDRATVACEDRRSLRHCRCRCFPEKCGQSSTRNFERVIDKLLTELLAKMRKASPSVREV